MSVIRALLRIARAFLASSSEISILRYQFLRTARISIAVLFYWANCSGFGLSLFIEAIVRKIVFFSFEAAIFFLVFSTSCCFFPRL
jgi:hypothetical protein